MDKNGKLYHVFSDGRNLGANCTFFALTPAPPCDQDVFYSYSTNGGATWNGPFRLTPPGTAQWMPWSAVVPNGSKLYVAYYDRSYGKCELTGCNDITLATIHQPATSHAWASYRRVIAVRLKVEQNQLVDVFGEIGVGVDGLKGA